MQSFCSLIYSLPDGNSSRNSPQIASILSYPAKYTLFHYITNNSSPSAKERRENIFRMKSIGEGLEWLRSKLEYDHAGQQHVSVTYYHCDLKPENIFVYEGTHNSPFPVQWKIGDFGSAFRWQNPLFDESEERIASPPVLRGRGREATYLAPEVQLQDKTKPKSDVWPFGCVLLLVILFNHGGKDGITSFAENRIKCSDPSRRGDHFAANSRNVNCNPAVTECIDSLIEISNRLMGLPDGRYYRLAKEVLEYIKQSMIVIHRKRDEIKDVVKRLRTIYDRESAIDPIPINRENVPRKSLHCGSSPDGHMVFFASSKEIAVYDDNDGTPAHLALVPASGGDKWTDDLLPTSRSCANLAVFTLPGSKNRVGSTDTTGRRFVHIYVAGRNSQHSQDSGQKKRSEVCFT
ncbi:kinase-like domain-containing protein [Ilyonectria sp. MPI-CAGE-AT-0026]|nr:kinase-like domain-containing protein [Ilyonectria sp. MPI-CAGE-AT-0026]